MRLFYSRYVYSLLSGLGLGLSLIVAIGAQNLFVLRQGIRREHVLAVVLVCAISDALLIIAGVAGLGFLLGSATWLVVAARWLGAIFLLGYGILAIRRAWRGEGDSLTVDEAEAVGVTDACDGGDAEASAEAGARAGAAAGAAAEAGTMIVSRGPSVPKRKTPLVPVLLTVLALTWLNPHVYLDTVLLLGSISSTHGDARWLFAAGAVTASLLWFTALGFGAGLLGRWLRTPRSWRILDAIIAVIMIAMAALLVLPVFTS